MQVLTTIHDLRELRSRLVSEASHLPVVGLVPTMGALHNGHIALIREARQKCTCVIVSIFVNPLQFGPNEDFSKYPRPLEDDLEMCRKEGVELVFNPSVEELYLSGQENTNKVVPPDALTSILCGAFRPGHFIGVATVVLKLFNVVQPDIAFFGEKDYQQLIVIRNMVADLDIPIKIVAVPTIRETDGLALSSRNAYLSTEQRKTAPVLYQTLCEVRDACLRDKLPLPKVLANGRDQIAALPDVNLQYLEACNSTTLKPLSDTTVPMVILAAAKFGAIRLIDNIVVQC
jgi:pantoate--beta-alanine ligase